MYSLEVRPEILGIDVLTKEDLCFLREIVPHIEQALADVCKYANKEKITRLLGLKTVSNISLFEKI